MEFGLFTEFHSPPGVTEAAAFDESMAQMKVAEDFGFVGRCWRRPSSCLRPGGVHAARQDRDRRPGPAAESPTAAGRGRRDRRGQIPNERVLRWPLEWILSSRWGTPGRSRHASGGVWGGSLPLVVHQPAQVGDALEGPSI